MEVKSSITQTCEGYVVDLLTKELSPELKYHNLDHTLGVRNACLELGKAMELEEEDLEILEISALFHDVGFIKTYQGHEQVSQQIAQDFLEQQDYPKEKLDKVLTCIDVTDTNNHPANLLQEIIRDADLHNLANEKYRTSIESLRGEWEHFLKKRYSNQEWDKLNINFMKSHQFYTSAAEELYGEQRDENLKALKKIVKKRKNKKKKKKDDKESGLMGSRTAQMMFKTALRNHIDLSTLADNKANIMLSVNALILTIVVPVASTFIRENPSFLLALLCLIVTCLISMIYATLATRPIRMKGSTEPEAIESGKANLFFFGNFFKMRFNDYADGMQVIMKNEEHLESAVMRDLFFLGRSLGQKFFQLRVCYNAFLFGMILTVIVFLYSFLG